MEKDLNKRLKRIESKLSCIIDLLRQDISPSAELEVKKIIAMCGGDNEKAIKLHSKMNKARYGR